MSSNGKQIEIVVSDVSRLHLFTIPRQLMNRGELCGQLFDQRRHQNRGKKIERYRKFQPSKRWRGSRCVEKWHVYSTMRKSGRKGHKIFQYGMAIKIMGFIRSKHTKKMSHSTFELGKNIGNDMYFIRLCSFKKSCSCVRPHVIVLKINPNSRHLLLIHSLLLFLLIFWWIYLNFHQHFSGAALLFLFTVIDFIHSLVVFQRLEIPNKFSFPHVPTISRWCGWASAFLDIRIIIFTRFSILSHSHAFDFHSIPTGSFVQFSPVK